MKGSKNKKNLKVLEDKINKYVKMSNESEKVFELIFNNIIKSCVAKCESQDNTSLYLALSEIRKKRGLYQNASKITIGKNNHSWINKKDFTPEINHFYLMTEAQIFKYLSEYDCVVSESYLYLPIRDHNKMSFISCVYYKVFAVIAKNKKGVRND